MQGVGDHSGRTCYVAAVAAVILFSVLAASLRFWTGALSAAAIYWLGVQFIASLGGNSPWDLLTVPGCLFAGLSAVSYAMEVGGF